MSGRSPGRHEPFHVRFRVGAPVAQRIEPEKWKRSSPRRQTTDPFTIQFPVSMDRALAEHAIVVVDRYGHSVEGTVTLDNGEKTWIFQPIQAWDSEEYQLHIATHLEDTAGNNLLVPLETVLGARPASTSTDASRQAVEPRSANQRSREFVTLALTTQP